MTPRGRVGRAVTAGALLLVLAGPRPASAQDPAPLVEPTPQSAPKVKELIDLMTTAGATAFAVKDPEREGRFAAVLLVPGVQLMVISAKYERTTDIEYWIYNKDFMSIYMELKSGQLSSEKFFVEDTRADGLVLQPEEGLAGDAVTVEDQAQQFDGKFTERPRRNDDRIPTADYYKAFSDADARYTRLLGLLIEGMKTAPTGLAGGPRLR